jgi:hypothetical protein
VVGHRHQALCLACGGLACVDDDQAVGSAGVIEQPLERPGGQRAGIARLGGRDQPQPGRLGERPLGGTLLVDGAGELAERERRGGPRQADEPAATAEFREQHRDGAVAGGAACQQVGERAGAGAAGEAADGDERTAELAKRELLAARRARCWATAREWEAAGHGCGCHLLTPPPCGACSSVAM